MNKPPRAICEACRRPFDPRSPGATKTMGSTCARRAGAPAGGSVRPPPERSFARGYQDAKLAFDELYRTFCPLSVPLDGAAAEALERDLHARAAVTFTLRDPSLDWLEPEHDLSLVVDEQNQMIYYRRVLNGVVTLLDVTPAGANDAGRHVAVITAYVRDRRAHDEEVTRTQPSLIDLS